MKTTETKVFFRYETDAQGHKVPNGKIEAIAVNNEGVEIARREVQLRHGDKPNKQLGRKYVFKKLMTHALNNNLLPGKEVEALWKQFGATCKQPEKKLAY